MKNREKDIYEDEIIEDVGLLSAIRFEPAGLVEQAMLSFNKHRKRYAALGGLTLGSLGFAAGAATFSHRH